MTQEEFNDELKKMLYFEWNKGFKEGKLITVKSVFEDLENDVRLEDGRISFPKEHYGNVKDFYLKRVGLLKNMKQEIK